jgi:DNA modification methylase
VTNSLYYGDNLQILRNEIRDESVDLVYLDPPFNSQATYNVLFSSPKGHEASAQIEAFEDTWHWGPQAEKEFQELVHQPNTDVSEMMQALRRFLGENDMMAYLTMMTNRLLELRRVLKPKGSLYLHCDPTASHYLKIVLDGVFGKLNFRTEINWRRSGAHSDAKQGRKQYGNVRDLIFFYTKSNDWTWNWLYTPYTEEYLQSEYRHRSPEGRYYKETDLTAKKPGGDTSYEWRVKRVLIADSRWTADLDDEYLTPRPNYAYLGVKPYIGRYWAYSKANLIEFAKADKLWHRSTGMPRLMQYADEMPGVPLQSDWQDIPPSSGEQDLGYDTQKPVALLERIIQASSNEGEIVLDPFCGCGTAIHAAQKLRRQWIGIDVTHLAISLVEKRLRDAFPGIAFEVHGTPKDFESARDLAQRDKYQFQWWACSLVNAQPYRGRTKGADTGIDGLIYFQDDESQIEAGKSLPKKIIVSVKAGENVSVPMIRDLGHVIDRENAVIGLFVTLTKPTRPMRDEAVKAGYYESPMRASFPKIQILTIEGLLNGTEQARYPDLMRGGLTFKRATREVKEKAVRLPGTE